MTNDAGLNGISVEPSLPAAENLGPNAEYDTSQTPEK
jgi:hypothetical protein